MAARDRAPLGAPCWTDLWTSDVDGSRSFYAGLFGWEPLEPSAEFGGYFMWSRDGVPVAGGMGDMGGMKATDTWQVYLQTPDIAKLAQLATEKGATVQGEPMAVADLGSQLMLTDPTGAHLGAWQPGTFEGFAATAEPGAPSWFELHTTDFDAAVDFYRSAFQWEVAQIGDTDEFRYTVMLDPEMNGELAGVMDSKASLGSSPSYWSIYWQVDDVATTLATVASLGGSVVDDAYDTPYGTLATVTDPAGARFKLRTPPSP